MSRNNEDHTKKNANNKTHHHPINVDDTINDWRHIDLKALNGVGGCLVSNDGRTYIGEFRYGVYKSANGTINRDLRFVPESYNASKFGSSSMLLIRNRQISTIAHEMVTRVIAVIPTHRHNRTLTFVLWDSFQYSPERLKKDERLLTGHNTKNLVMNTPELRDDYRENKKLRKCRYEADQQGLLDQPCIDPDVSVEELARLHDYDEVVMWR